MNRSRLKLSRQTMNLQHHQNSSTCAITGKGTNQKHNVARYASFASAIASSLCAGSISAYSLYGHLFQERLGYTQMQVNMVAMAAQIAIYLPVSGSGYLCDRLGPAPVSVISAMFFLAGYLLAAFAYRGGAQNTHDMSETHGWPVGVMVFAFVLIGLGTTLMYLSALTNCAKNFEKSRYKGFAMASPLAALGLSGLWQSQVGSRLLYERRSDGKRGDVDVFKFFIFLAITISLVGFMGGFLLRVFDADDAEGDAVEESERNALLESHPSDGQGYGSHEDHTVDQSANLGQRSDMKNSTVRRYVWGFNEEIRSFLRDHTMWWLMAGFFMVSGPSEAFVTNLGTILGTLGSASSQSDPLSTTAATHISIVNSASTLTRLIFGTLPDFIAPRAPNSSSSGFTISRLTLLIGATILLSLGQILLAAGFVQTHIERFWIISILIGSGYGALFSLTPLIISVIWGVDNFGTCWGIVSMVPALGATFWGLIYSWVYQYFANKYGGYGSLLCHGQACYAATFWAMAGSVWVGCAMWIWAWRGRGGWSDRGILV
ncbi:BgTH12-05066 [Blumeria graminis f. sp. triticale]|uniref:Probable transporter MCH1 n=2 Tax=Blumeria graminis TaxID=34373 RepID=A0A9X9MH66_BLUGR|nr:BgTH12-05066 [Blumeria graminis f. sp. triticale]VDB87814.1 Bgt-2888 [Blumeria graminis f. sp. tritici]